MAFIAIDHRWEKVYSLCILNSVTYVLMGLILLAYPLSKLFNYTCQDLPFDPTGELQSLRSFIEANVEICKWVGLTVVIIQVC